MTLPVTSTTRASRPAQSCAPDEGSGGRPKFTVGTDLFYIPVWVQAVTVTTVATLFRGGMASTYYRTTQAAYQEIWSRLLRPKILGSLPSSLLHINKQMKK